MVEDIQSLLEKIRRQGVEKAEAEAKAIITAAREQAACIVEEAQAKSKQIVESAQKESATFVERGKFSLTQAARDVVLSVGQILNRALEAIVYDRVSHELHPEALKPILKRVIETYCQRETGAITVLVPDELHEEIRDFFMTTFVQEMSRGLEVRGDDSVIAGFRISMREGKVEHDFSAEAITEALCQILRPHLAEILRAAVAEHKFRTTDDKNAPSVRTPPADA